MSTPRCLKSAHVDRTTRVDRKEKNGRENVPPPPPSSGRKISFFVATRFVGSGIMRLRAQRLERKKRSVVYFGIGGLPLLLVLSASLFSSVMAFVKGDNRMG